MGRTIVYGIPDCDTEQPSVIKRPVVEWDDGRITVGFEAQQRRA